MPKKPSLTSRIKGALSLQAVRYFISSGIAFAIDYIILLVLERLFSGLGFAMELSAVIAFAVSSQVNFHINRRWVFHSDKNILTEMGGYYALAAVSFSVKTFVLMEIMTRVLHLGTWLAKPTAEGVMYVVNFFVQKRLIFKRKKSESSENTATESIK